MDQLELAYELDLTELVKLARPALARDAAHVALSQGLDLELEHTHWTLEGRRLTLQVPILARDRPPLTPPLLDDVTETCTATELQKHHEKWAAYSEEFKSLTERLEKGWLERL